MAHDNFNDVRRLACPFGFRDEPATPRMKINL
jgi:hypothetical protein